MFRRSVTYRQILRITAIAFLLWALYLSFRIAAEPVSETFPNGVSDTRPLIQISFTETLFQIVYFGRVLYPVAIGILCLGLSLQQPVITYLSIQATVWLLGISAWYQFNDIFDPLPTNPFWIIITVIVSLTLLVLYKSINILLIKIARYSVPLTSQILH